MNQFDEKTLPKVESGKQLEPHILKLLTPEGFDERFYSLCQLYRTNELAYEALERQYESYFGKRRYSNYESYRKTKNKRVNK